MRDTGRAEENVMAKDVSTVLKGLLEKLKSRGQSEEEIMRVVDAKGDGLLDKFAEAIADATRQPREMFPLSVNYDLSVEDSVEAGEYQAVNASITSENFPSTRKGQAELEIILVRYDLRMTSESVLSELNKEGLRAAELPEFLAFGAKYPEVQRRFSIVGLGSECKDRRGYRSVPCLYEASEGRYLDLHWWDDGWYSYSRFAAIRKEVATTVG
jgi:hypothetical protein